MGRARGRARGVLGSGEHGDKRMGARRRWIAPSRRMRDDRCSIRRIAVHVAFMLLTRRSAGARVHVGSRSCKVRHGTRRASQKKAWRFLALYLAYVALRSERRPWPRSAGAMYFENTTKCRGRAPRENPRLAGRKPSRLAPPFATHESAEQRQNTPGQVSDSQSRARTVVKTCSTCLLSAAVLCRWASRPTAAPPQLWGRRAAANGLLTRGTRADGGAARAREARPGPELRPGQ